RRPLADAAAAAPLKQRGRKHDNFRADHCAREWQGSEASIDLYWYNSAVASGVPLKSIPPVTSTRPSLSMVAVCESRPLIRLPVPAKLAPDAAPSSAAACASPLESPPPATSTVPSCSNTAW